MSLKPKRVSKWTAQNPIARAVAAKQLRSTLLTYQIRLYWIDEEEHMQDLLQSVSRFFVLTILGCTYDKVFRTEMEDLDHILLLLTQITDKGSFVHRNQGPIIADALDLAVLLVNELTPRAIQSAEKQLQEIDNAPH